MNLQFQNITTGHNQEFVGGVDTWKATITGGSPNTPVTMFVRVNGVLTNSLQAGFTDSNGNFTISNVVPTVYGNWELEWDLFHVKDNVGLEKVDTVSYKVIPETGQVQAGAIQTLNAGNILVQYADPNATRSVYTSGVDPTTTQNTLQQTVGAQTQSNTVVVPTTQNQEVLSNTVSASPSFMDEFQLGMKALFNPADWQTVLASGSLGAMLGLLAVPAVAGFVAYKEMK